MINDLYYPLKEIILATKTNPQKNVKMNLKNMYAI